MKNLTAIMIITAISCFAGVREDAFAFVAKNEGFRSETYKCSAGKDTIGYGFTSKSLTSKGKITKEEADTELYRIIDLLIKKVNTNYPSLTDSQKVVMVDMMYHFGSSSIINAKDINAAIKSGDAEKVKTQLRRWNKAKVNGVYTEIQGLTNRCERRIKLWK